MRGYIDKTEIGKDLKELRLLCKSVEDNAANMSELELALAITEMNYQTRVFLRPELKIIPNENRL